MTKLDKKFSPPSGTPGSLRPAETPGYVIRRAQQRAVEIFDEELGEMRITPQQFAALRAVEARPGLSQIDVVDATGIDRSTTTELVGRLVDRGLLRMNRSGEDRRSMSLFLTEAGHDLLLSAVPGVKRAQERIMAPISAARRAPLLRQLARLAGMDMAADAVTPFAHSDHKRTHKSNHTSTLGRRSGARKLAEKGRGE